LCYAQETSSDISFFSRKIETQKKKKRERERILKIPLCDTQNPNGRFETNFSYCYFVYSSFTAMKKLSFYLLIRELGWRTNLVPVVVLSWKTRQQFTKLNSSVKNNFRFQRLFVFVEKKKAFFH